MWGWGVAVGPLPNSNTTRPHVVCGVEWVVGEWVWEGGIGEWACCGCGSVWCGEVGLWAGNGAGWWCMFGGRAV